MANIEKQKSEIPNPKSQMIRNLKPEIIFPVLIVFVYLFALGLPLLGPDEPRYAQVAREMFERGDLVTPTLGGANWFEKPALLYWLQIFFYHIFGVTEFAARLGSALFGLGTIFSLWLLGKQYQRTTANKHESDGNDKSQIRNPKSEIAHWLMLISASSLGLLVFARGASFDIMITFPVTAALVSFFIWETNRRDAETERNGDGRTIIRHLPLILFYFFIGVALIAKGLIGIVFPFAIVAFYYVLCRKLPDRSFLLSLVWGTFVSVLVASLWYLPMYLRHGWEFIDEFIIRHHFLRYASNEYKHPQPFWFFWVIFPLFTIPWLPFFLAAIWNYFKTIFKRRDAETQSKSEIPNPKSQIQLLAVAWMLVPLVFFSLSGSKLPGYILPALPGACILTAVYVERFVRKSDLRRYALQGLALLMFAVVIVLLQFVVRGFAERDSTRQLVERAAAEGFRNEKILNMHTISHNIEFYGHGRLVREPGGEQRKFYTVTEITDYLKKENSKSALVLVPHDFLHELTENGSVTTEIIDRNEELTMAAVSSER
jgi:4-amino-4-deoxy-L-arabinose transferase-like glycosyltransferase